MQKLFCLEYLSTNLKTEAVLVHRHNQNEARKHHPPPEELLSQCNSPLPITTITNYRLPQLPITQTT